MRSLLLPLATLQFELQCYESANQAIFEQALEEFIERLMSTGVIVRDLNPQNLCARKRRDGSYQLIAIDGIGHRDFIPFCDYSLSYARRKLRKSLARNSMNSISELLDRHKALLPQTGQGDEAA